MQTTEEARKYLNKKREGEYAKKPFLDNRNESLQLLFELRSDVIKQFEKKIGECENSTINK